MLQDKHVLSQVIACSGYLPSWGNSLSKDLPLPVDSGDHTNILKTDDDLVAPRGRQDHMRGWNRAMNDYTLYNCNCVFSGERKTSEPIWEAKNVHLLNSTQSSQWSNLVCVWGGDAGGAGVYVENKKCKNITIDDFDSPLIPYPGTYFLGFPPFTHLLT